MWVNLLGWLVGLGAVYLIGERYRIPQALNLLFYGINAGLLFSLLYPLADVWASALVFAAIACWVYRRHGWACLAFGLAGLAKETTVLVPGAIMLHQLWCKREYADRKNALLCLALLPILAWEFCIHEKFGGWPFQAGIHNLDYPLLGIAKFTHSSLRAHLGSVCAGAMFSGLSLYSLNRIRKPKDELEMMLGMQAVLFICLGTAIVENIPGSSRIAILLSQFLFWEIARQDHATNPPGDVDLVKA
jgi:hypothetical protein